MRAHSALAALLFSLTLCSTQSAAKDAWGAFTACCAGGGRGSSCNGAVSTGFASGPSQDAAKAGSYQQAVSDVNSSVSWKCSTVRVFNRGCAYIAEGCNDNQCAWVIAGSGAEALRKLDTGGYPKHEASPRGGGCVGQ